MTHQSITPVTGIAHPTEKLICAAGERAHKNPIFTRYRLLRCTLETFFFQLYLRVFVLACNTVAIVDARNPVLDDASAARSVARRSRVRAET